MFWCAAIAALVCQTPRVETGEAAILGQKLRAALAGVSIVELRWTQSITNTERKLPGLPPRAKHPPRVQHFVLRQQYDKRLLEIAEGSHRSSILYDGIRVVNFHGDDKRINIAPNGNPTHLGDLIPLIASGFTLWGCSRYSIADLLIEGDKNCRVTKTQDDGNTRWIIWINPLPSSLVTQDISSASIRALLGIKLWIRETKGIWFVDRITRFAKANGNKAIAEAFAYEVPDPESSFFVGEDLHGSEFKILITGKMGAVGFPMRIQGGNAFVAMDIHVEAVEPNKRFKDELFVFASPPTGWKLVKPARALATSASRIAPRRDEIGFKGPMEMEKVDRALSRLEQRNNEKTRATAPSILIAFGTLFLVVGVVVQFRRRRRK